MKSITKLPVGAAFAAALFFAGSFLAQAEVSPVNIKYLGGVHGPVHPDVGTSPSFTAFLSNRGQQMLAQVAGSYSTVGTAYAQSKVEPMEYSKMVATPSFESWHAMLAPASNEHGNLRYDEGFYVYINGGTFVPSDVTVNCHSEIWDGTNWVVGGGIAVNTTLATVHAARIRMIPGADNVSGTTDDQPHTVQTGSIASTGFVFIGPAVGGIAYGAGDNQQKMQNVVDYYAAKKMRLVHTVTVPSTLGTYVFTKTNEAGGGGISNLTITTMGSVGTLNWTADGRVTVIQRSFDLAEWADVQTLWYPKGQSATYPITLIDGQPKAFWRLATPQ